MLNSVEELQKKLADAPCALTTEEQLPIEDIGNRHLAHDIHVLQDVPPANNSAMDGYAVIRAQLEGNDYKLPISQRIAAGNKPQALEDNTCARIFTGANIPSNTDAVIMQEDATIDDNGILFKHKKMPKHFENIRSQGQDLSIGEPLAKAGDKITPALHGLLASQGFAKVAVKPQLRVALLSTGDEIVQPGAPLEEGQLYNSNQFTISGLLRAWSDCEITCHHIPDSAEATRQALTRAAPNYDLLISFGGVSVGEEDHIKAIVSELGNIDHWKVKLKPGKPLMYGRINYNGRSTPILGLPGNPVSAFVTFLLFGKPLLCALSGSTYTQPKPLSLPIGFSIDKPRSRPEYARVMLDNSQLVRCKNQSSGVLSSLNEAYALALIPDNKTLSVGDKVDSYPLSDLIYG